MEASTVIDDASEVSVPAQLPSGPRSLAESFEFGTAILDALGDHTRLVEFWFLTSLKLKTEYSGMGCFEMALEALAIELAHRLFPDDPRRAAKFLRHAVEYNSSCDVDSQCRQILMSEGSNFTTPQKCFTDIIERLPLDTRMQFKAVLMPSKEWLLDAQPYEIEAYVKDRMDKALDLLEKPGVFTRGSFD